MRDAFNLFDTDGSGEITVEELAYALQGVGQDASLEEIKEMITKGDKDSDGMVSFEEFKELVQRQMAQADGPEEVLKAFQAFDTSHSGEITMEDLTEVARSLGYLQTSENLSQSITDKQTKEGLTVTPYDVKEIFDYCAANDDGKFTFFAWRKVMDEMRETGRGRGDASLYKELPKPDDDIWQQLEEKAQKEKVERAERARQAAAEVEERRIAAKHRRGNAQKGQEDVEAITTSQAAGDQMRRGSREGGKTWDDQKLKLIRRQELQQKQREEEEAKRAAEVAEAERVARKLEEKRAAAAE